MLQAKGLEEIAALASALSPEKRRELERQLSLDGNPRFNEGIAVGLLRAVEAVAEQLPELNQPLRELAAVAAAYVLAEQRAYEEARRLTGTAQARAEIEEEIARLESGQVKIYSGEQILRELEEMEKEFKESGGGQTS